MLKKKNYLLITLLAGLKLNGIYHDRKSVTVDVNSDKVLILGSGGILGAVWEVSTIKRLSEEGSFDISDYKLRIGTSAGALSLALVEGELSMNELGDILLGGSILHKGEPIVLPRIDFIKEKGKLNNPRFFLNALKYLQLPRFNNILSSLIPEGATDLAPLGEFVNRIQPFWPHVATYIISSDLDTGKRVIFNNLSNVTLGDAVMSSCSVPGLFKPIIINNRRFIDGRVRSSINYDLALKAKPKEITIITPSTGFTFINLKDKPFQILAKISKNMLEFHLRRIQLFCYIKQIKLTVIRPREREEVLIKEHGLFDITNISNLYLETQKK